MSDQLTPLSCTVMSISPIPVTDSPARSLQVNTGARVPAGKGPN